MSNIEELRSATKELIRAAELIWIRQERATEEDWGNLFNALQDAQDEAYEL